MTFDEWVIWLFERPVTASGGDFDDDPQRWSAGPLRVIEFLTRLFMEAGPLLEPYSDKQVRQGLWYLMDQGHHLQALYDREVSWPGRKRCILAVHALYEGCFQSRCSPHLWHLAHQEAGPLNEVCYRWWEHCGVPATGDERDENVDAAVLDVLQRILHLDSVACQESGLRGLSVRYEAHPQRVESSINRFLDHHVLISAELREYALAAKAGTAL